MNSINITITKKRFSTVSPIRSKFKDKNWYKFLAYTIPFCYIFYILEKLKLVHSRPWRFEQTNCIVFDTLKKK